MDGVTALESNEPHPSEDDKGSADLDEKRVSTPPEADVHSVDPEPEPALLTSKWELWAWYFYYVGCQGLGPFNYGPSQFQNLLFLAGEDLQQPGQPCSGSDTCVLPFAGTTRDINSVVLICNGIAFAIQAVLFVLIGSYADYGSWRPWILTFFTALAIATSFAWLGVEDPAKWHSAAALYILNSISYQGCITFWTAAFPRLSRNLPEMQESFMKLSRGETTPEEHDKLDTLSRNRLSNVSFAIQSLGELIFLAFLVGILFALNPGASTEANTRAFSVLIAITGGLWVICAAPWFMLEKRRPGQKLPPGTSWATIGIKQLYAALRECLKLKDTFIYLIFYFLMGDVLNTTVTVIGTLQNSIVSYSTLQLTYLLILGIGTQMIGIYGFWVFQKRFVVSTKTMFSFNVFWIVILTGWGMVGIWTDNFGFKNVWEVYAYQAFYGLLVCPWYAYSQTMISEFCPKGKEFLFFALFSIIGKTSSFIGPFVSSAIISDSGNNNMPFAFLFALGTASTALLFLVNVKRSQKDCAEYLAREKTIIRDLTLHNEKATPVC